MSLLAEPGIIRLENCVRVANKQDIIKVILMQSFAQGLKVDYSYTGEGAKYLFSSSQIGVLTEVGNDEEMKVRQMENKIKNRRIMEEKFKTFGIEDADFSLDSPDTILPENFKPHRDGRILLPNGVLTDGQGFLSYPIITVLVYFSVGADLNIFPLTSNPKRMNRDPEYNNQEQKKKRVLVEKNSHSSGLQIAFFGSETPHSRNRIMHGDPDHLLLKAILRSK